MFHTRFRRDVGIRYAFQVLLVQCLLFNAVASAQTWTPAWSDEFDGEARSAIDPKKWQFERGDLKVNNELEFYCAPTDPAPEDAAPIRRSGRPATASASSWPPRRRRRTERRSRR